ncbi:MAG: hypothetical protein DWQ35_09095 [Planctomycetota bacterium]|nr:MAG: hypothetical protein DWQ35_09095 [Planctomycetota bacterium]
MSGRQRFNVAGTTLAGFLLTALAFAVATSSQADDDPQDGQPPDAEIRVLKGDGHGQMMQRYLFAELDRASGRRDKAFKERTARVAIDAHHADLRRRFVDAIGGLTPRTPLNAQVTGTVRRDGFVVEKILFESRPNHHVTAALFLPESSAEPDAEDSKRRIPGVLIPCGHAELAKADPKYQRAAALLALNGMAALVFDPIDQGERMQLIDRDGNYEFWGTKGHLTVGIGCILLGSNTAEFMIHDGMRAIDYLQSRPEIDPERIGCMGNSGGGTQTAYLAALDDRIKAAAPSCYITSFPRLLKSRGGQDSEQTIYAQLAWGMDHADYLTMRLPTPQLVCAATGDFFDIRGTWDSFRQAKRLYSRLGHAERIAIVEHDGPHGYAKPLREASARWMARWLLGEDRVIVEPEIEVLTPEEIQVTARGQVMLLTGERSVYDLNDERLARLEKARGEFDAGRVRALAGIRRLRLLTQGDGMRHLAFERDGLTLRPRTFATEKGIQLPMLTTFPGPSDLKVIRAPGSPAEDATRVLFVHQDGKSADLEAIRRIYQSGHDVMAVDLRGTGETLQKNGFFYARRFGSDGLDVIMAYLLGKSYVGMRAEDILVCAQELNRRRDGAMQPVRLVAHGHVTVPALHAAAVEPQLFTEVELHGGLVSWAKLIEQRVSYRQLVNHVHGALAHYDLPDLVAAIRAAGVKVTIHGATDALGQPL